MDNIQNKIENLKKEINKNNRLYYIEDAPIITDYEYDKMMRELMDLEEKYKEYKTLDSPTMRVGGKALEKFEQVVHTSQVQSLANAFSYDELREFDERIKRDYENPRYVLELKIDGLSLVIEYRDGIMYRAATRGDGFIGEDVTENARTIKSLPLRVDELKNFKIRGEVFISKENFVKINEKQLEDGKNEFANPRNAAAGSIRQLDSKVASKRNLDIFIFNLENIEGKTFKYHSETLEYLKSLGFHSSPFYEKCEDIEKVIEKIKYWDKKRHELKFNIDGMVVKIDDLELRKKLGSTSKTPKWALSYKFPPELAKTKLIDIILQVGRTGVITPTGILEPVKLAGSTISRVTLHNYDYICERDILIGDTVYIHKAGEIIPEIYSVVKEERTGNEKEFKMPEKCPSCNSELVKYDGEVAIRCPNTNCPNQRLRSIIHFASKGAMDITGFGEKIAEKLYEENLVKEIQDIYRLQASDIVGLERMGQKSSENLINAIDQSKKASFDKVIFALGIRFVGSTTAKILAEKFKNIDSLMGQNKEELNKIDEIGEKIAESIVNFFKVEENKKLIADLKKLGINMKADEKSSEKKILEGKRIAFTGKLENYKRSDVTEIIENLGGKVTSSISENLFFLLAGENAGNKLDKAREKNIKIISEEDFKKIISFEEESQIDEYIQNK